MKKRTQRGTGLIVVLAVLATLYGTAGVALAAPVYEITARWAPNTPDTVSSGDVVSAEWRVNVNDDAEAPANDPVDNVNFVLTIDNGTFQSRPDSCLTVGVTPVSSISADRKTLVCNLGTQFEGSAHVVYTPVLAAGPTGSQVTGTGSIEGASADLDPIDIVNPFGMDMAWLSPTAGVVFGDDYAEVDYQWTLFLDRGSEAGPNSVSYVVDVAADNGSAVIVAPSACSTFDVGNAPGHPWSGGTHPAANMAPFVGTCTLTPTATPGRFTLTLTGIDYSLAQVPTRDSTNAPLPVDRVAVASGSVTFRFATTTNTGTLLSTNAPTYTAPASGATDTDDAANNTSSKAINFPGGYNNAWNRAFTGAGGTPWDNSYQVSPGTVVRAGMSIDTRPYNSEPGDLYGVCEILDPRYVNFVSAASAGFDTTVYPLQYYVGNDATIDPASGSYNPDVFDCSIGGNTTTGGGGWVTTLPADLTTVKAVRAVYPFSETQVDPARESLTVVVAIDEAAPIGQDIWTWGSPMRAGVWEPQDHPPVTNIPGGRYPYTHVTRDVLHVVSATPAVEKTVDRAQVKPGVPATYTLTYSANGGGGAPPTVNDFELVDTLPAGVTYVVGSASPAPTVSMDGNQQVLTWSIDNVATNTDHALTYQAVADASVTPGQVLTNSVVASFGGLTADDTAQVTVSTNGYTLIGKSPDQSFIANPTAEGVGTGSWTVTLRSFDPLPQAYTDTIDILPFNGDGRGTSFNGTYTLESVTAPAGATVYYTTAPPLTISDDPGHESNGVPGNPAGNDVGWTTIQPASGVTAVRVIGPELPPSEIFQFQVAITTDGALGGDTYVNRAQARAGHTELVMRTSAPTVMATFYSASLKKYVQDRDGEWRDANEAADYPTLEVGEDANYRIVIENTGQGTLTNFDIEDDLFPGGTFHVDSLAPQESVTHEFTVPVTEAMLGTVVNTACVAVDTPPDAPAPDIPCDPAGIDVARTTFDKTLVGMTPNGDGTYSIVYDIDVSREGVAGVYNLLDRLRYGAAITVEDTEVVNTAPGTIDTADDWNGISNPTVVANQAIAAGTVETPTVHTYQVTVVASVDEIAATFASTDCTLGEGESGTGFYNEATLEVDDRELVDDECPSPPATVIAKRITTDPTGIGNGRYEVVYEITVTNKGAGADVYDLDDTLRFGSSISIVSAAAAHTAPGGVTVNAAWNGTSDTAIAAAVPIAAATAAGSTVHTYTVTVVVAVEGGIAPTAADCELTDGETGTGLLNSAVMTANGEERDADACGRTPVTTFEKELVGVTANRDGTSTVTYTLTVRRTGTGSPYNLSDRLRYGAAASIQSTTVTATSPNTLSVNNAWNGVTDTLVAGNVAIGDGETHVYTTQVVVSISGSAVTPSNRDCELGGGEGGTGLLNQATLETNGVEFNDDACAPYDPPPARLPRTGAETTVQLAAALTMMAAGALILLESRRRRRGLPA